ncbi:Ribonuclease H-like protein [Dioscorea alata]|uniref:Ribonuclease H-like protein n=1 Tax=Dioscorea alata TaxID=55571 RepID=A0ACB7WTM6_DIOAL|nr:Ribonuclease H-like protein [Dioscorea alata]
MSSTSDASTAAQKKSRVEFDPSDIIADPGLQKPIEEYDTGIRDQVRREYLLMGQCQLVGHNFPRKQQGKDLRSFKELWFQKLDWLEYSVEKVATYCFCCYLLKQPRSDKLGIDAFTKAGRHCEDLKNQRQSVSHIFSSHSREMEIAYRARAIVVLHVIRFLLLQGLAFCGHDESSSFTNRGNFKELVRACAEETTRVIIDEIGDNHFSILLDESLDKSIKEQMTVIVRFIDVEHVVDTSAFSLKIALDGLFARCGLSISRLRGQGYDGASNMRGQFNGLKTLILNENPFAFYVHCFAHQWQLVVFSVARSILAISDFFSYVTMIVNIVGASYKRRDEEAQHQETNLARPGDTRWGSYYTTLIGLFTIWESLLEVLENVCNDGNVAEQRGMASGLIQRMESFEFIFILHLMIKVLGLTNDLSNVLQQKDQNIVNVIGLIVTVKELMQGLRENGWKIVYQFEVVRDMEDSIPMVQTDKHLTLPLVYYLIELALILPVAIVTVERALSVMNIIKTYLRKK